MFSCRSKITYSSLSFAIFSLTAFRPFICGQPDFCVFQICRGWRQISGRFGKLTANCGAASRQCRPIRHGVPLQASVDVIYFWVMEQFWSLGFQNFLEPEIKLLVSLIWGLGTFAILHKSRVSLSPIANILPQIFGCFL